MRDGQHLAVLPHLFELPELARLGWSDWHRLAHLLPERPGGALAVLPPPRPFDAVNRRCAQARLVIGGLRGSPGDIERFVAEGCAHEDPHVAAIVAELQGQLGIGHGLKVVAGVPALATAALSNGKHMNNLGQFSCLAALASEQLMERVAFRAEAITDKRGEGTLRFRIRSASADWELSKSEPWWALQMHWRLLLGTLPARFLRVQLGLVGP